MTAIMAAQRTVVHRAQTSGVRVILAAWGAAWLIGFLALWSGDHGGNPLFRLPAGLEWWIFAASIVAGSVISAIVGARMGRGVRGGSTLGGQLFGWASAAAMAGTWLFLSALRVHVEIDQQAAALLYVGAFALTVGVIYMAGAAMTRSHAQFFFGLTVVALAIVATLIGAPHHLLVYALAGGGLMLAYALVLGRGARR